MTQQRTNIALTLLLGLGAFTAIGISAPSPKQRTTPLRFEAAPGHPNADMAPVSAHQSNPAITAIIDAAQEGIVPPNEIIIPVLSALESGPYVNFESPPVIPLAIAGDQLLVTNTPAGTLEVFSTTGGDGTQLQIKSTIAVGIDPVAVVVEPNTNDSIAWVSNYVGDSISIVDLTNAKVIQTLEAGDEPSSIAFSNNGQTAYIVFEGAAPTVDGEFITPSPALGIYDVPSRTLLSWIDLPADTPRALVVDPNADKLYIAALRSGNNTTVVGEPVLHTFINGDTVFRPVLQIVRDFSVTSSLFATSSFAPYPPVSVEPGAPLTSLIINDDDPEWQAILDLLTDANGDPDTAVVTQYANENNMAFNDALFVIEHILSDVKDTTDNDIIVVDTASPQNPFVDRIIPDVGTILTAMAIQPGQDKLFVTNLEALNTIRHEPNLNGHFFDHQVVSLSTTIPANPQQHDLHAGIANFNDTSSHNQAAFDGSLANPVDVDFSTDGSRMLIAALGSGRVGLLDPTNSSVLDVVDSGKGTRAVIYNTDNTRAYAYNRTDNSVSTIDIVADSLTLIDTLDLFNPEPAKVTIGRDFLYSTNFSNNNASSCAMCHIDSHLDALAWDLGDPDGVLQPGPPNLIDPSTGLPFKNHPAKGPMVTMSLKGLKDHDAYHWRSDKTVFQDFNIAFQGLLGGEQISPTDMDSYRDFANTIVYPPNPFYDRDNSFKDPRAVQGVGQYIANCQACHSISNDGTLRIDGNNKDAGLQLFGIFAQLQEMTQLRGIHRKFDMDKYSGFGLVHDGREEREANAHPIETFLFTFFPGIPVADHDDVIAFLNAFQTNVMSIVGFQSHLDEFTQAAAVPDVLLMISRSQHIPGFSNEPVCDTIAQGTVAGQPRSFVYIPGSGSSPSNQTGAPGATNGTSMPGANINTINMTQINLTPIGKPSIVPGKFMDDAGNLFTIQQVLNLAMTPGNSLDFSAVTPGSGIRLGIDYDQDGILNAQDPFVYRSPDIDDNSTINSDDLLLFLDLFAQSDPQADYNADRIVDIHDSDAFVFEYNHAQ